MIVVPSKKELERIIMEYLILFLGLLIILKIVLSSE